MKVMNVAAASIPLPATLDPADIVPIKNGNVFNFSLSMYNEEVPLLFQKFWNAKIATVAKAGLMMGSTISRKIWKSVAPSINAASNNSLGIWSINCFTKNRPTGIANAGIIWTKKLSYKPSFTMIKKRGIVTATGTNINAIWFILKSSFFVLNFNFDSPKPAIEVIINVHKTPKDVVTIELNKYREKGIPEVDVWRNRLVKFFNVGLATKNFGG